MKKTIIIIMLAAFLFLSFVPFTMAAEINPTPGTYGYGSTSEFSASMQLGQGTIINGGGSSSGSLAPTGENKLIPVVVAMLLIFGSFGVSLLVIKKLKAR